MTQKQSDKEAPVAQQTAPRRPRRTAYDHGYLDGYEQGEEAFRNWLLAELLDLARDIRLGLRHDLSPEETLAAVVEIIEEGRPDLA